MVDSIKPSGMDRVPPMARSSTKMAETGFIVDGGATPLNQKARLSPAATVGLEGLFALQAVDERAERDRSARKHGTALLASLTGLQRTLLVGEDPSQVLRALTELTADESAADDPGLAAILRAIVQRSRIEIARRERAESERGSD